jgi:hypothetical protein
MKIKSGLILGITVCLILISANLIFSQEPAGEPEMQWVWGEVVTLDTQNRIIMLKYLDYETDQEKRINIKTDDLTAYEGSGSINQIKPKDTLSIDYIVSASGENIAKNISVEKPEDTQGTQKGDIMEEGQITE